MTKQNKNLQNIFCGILLCISIAALIMACLAFTKKSSGEGFELGHFHSPSAPDSPSGAWEEGVMSGYNL